jgi:hypothetical protein
VARESYQLTCQVDLHRPIAEIEPSLDLCALVSSWIVEETCESAMNARSRPIDSGATRAPTDAEAQDFPRPITKPHSKWSPG